MDDLSIFTMDCENESSDFFSPVVIQDSTLIDVFDNAIDSFEEADLYGDICMDGTINAGSVGDAYSLNVCGNYTQSEINSHIHECEDKIHHYQSVMRHHMQRAHDYRAAEEDSHAEYELSRAVDAKHEIKKYASQLRKWQNETPKK